MSYRPDAPMTAPIVEWNYQKGFGFLQVGKSRLFLHRRDFSEHHKRPKIGDLIHFKVGTDVQGRTCAKEATHVNDGGKFTPLAFVTLGALLVLPLLALHQGGVDWRLASGAAAGISLLSYVFYAADKRYARQKRWRVSEAGLHLTELLGGWPGAFVAQRRLRHKVSKGSYQIIFWLIVAAYQFAALDSMLGWKLTRAGLHYLNPK